MPALEAYAHSVENVVFVETVLNKNAYAHSVEQVVEVSPLRLNAYAHSVENVTYGPLLPTVVRDAVAYAYDHTLVTPPVASRDATAYAYDHTLVSPPVASRDAVAYAYDNTITVAHPSKIWRYDAPSGTWNRVTVMWRWNGTTFVAVV